MSVKSKKCSGTKVFRCGRVLECTSANFYMKTGGKLSSICKLCAGKYQKHRYIERKQSRPRTPDEQVQTCSGVCGFVCGRTLPATTDYFFVGSNKYGLSRHCRRCMSEWNANGGREANRGRHLKRKFGISKVEYRKILEAQDGVCGICRQPEKAKSSGGGIRQLAVDHDHETGRIRGLLCHKCNLYVGYVDTIRRDPAKLEAATRYLLRQPDERLW